jgi:Tol biopolymer transport system component
MRGGALLVALAFFAPVAAVSQDAPKPRVEKLRDQGGHVGWYRGDKHELIAFDSVVDPRTGSTAVYTMRPDGKDVKCVTCGLHLEGRFVGQPSWHPDGEHLVIQVENQHSHHGMLNHVAWGIDNDLWLVSRDGKRVQRIWRSEPLHAAAHPHWSADGRLLVFAERAPTGVKVPGRRPLNPALEGENQWDGWRIRLAEVDLTKTGEAVLSNVRTLFSGVGGFFETHGFSHDGWIVFSHTHGARPYVDAVYAAPLDATRMVPLVRNPGTWNEHGASSPSGHVLAYVSSRADPTWIFPGSHADTLRTELFVEASDGKLEQITRMNAERDPSRRYLVTDFDWDREGRRIVAQVTPVDARTGRFESPELWMVTFASPR